MKINLFTSCCQVKASLSLTRLRSNWSKWLKNRLKAFHIRCCFFRQAHGWSHWIKSKVYSQLLYAEQAVQVKPRCVFCWEQPESGAKTDVCIKLRTDWRLASNVFYQNKYKLDEEMESLHTEQISWAVSIYWKGRCPRAQREDVIGFHSSLKLISTSPYYTDILCANEHHRLSRNHVLAKSLQTHLLLYILFLT